MNISLRELNYRVTFRFYAVSKETNNKILFELEADYPEPLPCHKNIKAHLLWLSEEIRKHFPKPLLDKYVLPNGKDKEDILTCIVHEQVKRIFA